MANEIVRHPRKCQVHFLPTLRITVALQTTIDGRTLVVVKYLITHGEQNRTPSVEVMIHCPPCEITPSIRLLSYNVGYR